MYAKNWIDFYVTKTKIARFFFLIFKKSRRSTNENYNYEASYFITFKFETRWSQVIYTWNLRKSWFWANAFRNHATQLG